MKSTVDFNNECFAQFKLNPITGLVHMAFQDPDKGRVDVELTPTQLTRALQLIEESEDLSESMEKLMSETAQ